MTIQIVVPQVGEAVSEVTLVQWLKKEGDQIQQGEPLFEVDTDKAVVEVEAFASGVLSEILVPDGSAVMPQQVVGLLRPAPETPAGRHTVPETAEPSSDGSNPESKASPTARRLAAELGIDLDQVRGSGAQGRVMADDVRRMAAARADVDGHSAGRSASRRVLASPKARRLARELGVDLAGLTGSGVEGLITADDVQAAAKRAAEPAPEVSTPSEDEVQVVPFSKLRRTIATRMQTSKQTVPHFYLMVEVEMTLVQQLRTYCYESLGWDSPPTYTDIIVRACALALEAMPQMNVHFTDAGIARRQTIDIGLAVNVKDGLIVPVLPRADRLSLRQTMHEGRDLVERTRQGRLREGDLGQKSMVVSNLGMHGIDAFAAIIDMPDPMILAVGRVADRIIPVAGQPAVRPICTLTLSADHRVLDGVQAAQFLTRVKAILENPFEIIGEGK